MSLQYNANYNEFSGQQIFIQLYGIITTIKYGV